MCGILAIKGTNPPFHHVLVRSLRKRGPDAVGFWTDGHLNLAHTRLSIIGLDESGTQPIEDDRHVIAYNGEIYNFMEIKERLRQAGEHLHTSCDTEVLLRAWSRWGPEILTKLTGFWAFVIYDKHAHTLTLVRDQLGIKPLYYWHTDQFTCVASLLRTVLEVVRQTPELDYEAMSEYVRYQFTFGDKTFCKHIKKVLPGHYIEIDLNTNTLVDRCYEDILAPPDQGTRELSEDIIRETKDLIVQCCQESTISDTAYTTFCSGGMDSSFITSTTRPEVAYHCNYSDPDCNETFYAREVVASLPTRLMVVNAQESFDLIERLKNLIEDFDEPTIGSVILPLDDLLTQVKRRYKVILTGTGGDELFAGYVRYQLTLGKCFQDSYRALYERMKTVEDAGTRFEMTHSKGDTKLYAFYDPQVEATFRGHFDTCRNGSGNDLHAMLTFDRRYFLAGLLNIDDKLCGRHSLESRPSFLHQSLVRHVLRIKPEDLIRNDQLKFLLKRAAETVLPASIIRRTDKMGFTTPIGTFINNSADVVREQITGSKFSSFYNLKPVRFTAETKFSREVFGLLMLDLWLNRYACPGVAKAAAS